MQTSVFLYFENDIPLNSSDPLISFISAISLLIILFISYKKNNNNTYILKMGYFDDITYTINNMSCWVVMLIFILTLTAIVYLYREFVKLENIQKNLVIFF